MQMISSLWSLRTSIKLPDDILIWFDSIFIIFICLDKIFKLCCCLFGGWQINRNRLLKIQKREE